MVYHTILEKQTTTSGSKTPTMAWGRMQKRRTAKLFSLPPFGGRHNRV